MKMSAAESLCPEWRYWSYAKRLEVYVHVLARSISMIHLKPGPCFVGITVKDNR